MNSSRRLSEDKLPHEKPNDRRGIVIPAHHSPLPGDGERYLPHQHGDIRLEHLHRYLLAGRWCSGKRVLDIACGEGYGSFMLSQTAAQVTGADLDTDSIAAARERYDGRENLDFIAADCRALPLPDASFDVIVSFETIEHIADHDAFLRECRRLLTPDGMLILSTPNRPRYRRRDGAANPFHARELDRTDLAELLEGYFPYQLFLGQQVMRGSLIVPVSDRSEGIETFFEGRDHVASADELREPVYFLALASRLPLEPASTSFFADAVRTEDGSLVDRGAAELVQLYLDTGAGYSPHPFAQVRTEDSLGRVIFSFAAESPIAARKVRMRLGIEPCLVKLVAASSLDEKGERHDLASAGDNAVAAIEGCSGFLSFDPGIEFTPAGKFNGLEFILDYRAGGLEAVQRIMPALERRLDDDRRYARIFAHEHADQRQLVETQEKQLSQQEQTLAALRAEVEGLRRELEPLSAQVIEQEKTLYDETSARLAAETRATQSRGELDWIRAEIDLVSRSVSWRTIRRISAGLRRVHLIRDLAESFRGYLALRESRRLVRTIRNSGEFDAEYYLHMYPEVAAQGIDPLLDFAHSGWRHGRRPNPRFDPCEYLQRRPDVALLDVNPLYHYLRFGRRENGGAPPVATQDRAAVEALAARLSARAGGQATSAAEVITPASGESWRTGASATSDTSGAGGARLAVCLHGYYPDLLPELLKLLGRLPCAYDLLISTCEPVYSRVREILKRDNQPCEIHLKSVPNRGRNFGPLLIAFSAELARYDLALHLHTKKSVHLASLAGWRHFLLQQLIGSGPHIREIIAAFEADERLGVQIPACYPPLQVAVASDPWRENWEMCSLIAGHLNIQVERDMPLLFPVGGMFWFRPAALRPLFSFGFEWGDFTPENGAADGTLAHALERLICPAARVAGYTWKEIPNPAGAGRVRKQP